MNFAVGNIVGRLTSSERNQDGHWTVQYLRDEQGRMVSVVSVYEPCKANHGQFTFWEQLCTAHTIKKRPDYDPPKKFASDLIAYLQGLYNTGHLLIVGGDINVTFGAAKTVPCGGSVLIQLFVCIA